MTRLLLLFFLLLPLPAVAADCIPLVLEHVHDGDTIRATVAGESERVRLMGLDTPEIDDKARCPAEQAAAVAARDRLEELIEDAADRRLCPNGRDKYKRLLAWIILDGRDAAAVLIQEGLARPYDGGKRQGWCE